MVLAHGFTQNSKCWGALPTALEKTHAVRLVDMPGHGSSGHDDVNLSTSGDLLVEAGGHATYVGYSMGGRIALHAALQHPSQISKLVLIGVNPGLTNAADQQKRRDHDAELADRLEREGLELFLQRWLANPLFEGLPLEAASIEHRLANRISGLAATLRTRSVGWQEPLWGRLSELAMPVLLVAGQDDTKYRTLNRQAAERIPNAEIAVLPGSHAVHLQQPEQLSVLIGEL